MTTSDTLPSAPNTTPAHPITTAKISTLLRPAHGPSSPGRLTNYTTRRR
jgi:hypothetical protein